MTSKDDVKAAIDKVAADESLLAQDRAALELAKLDLEQDAPPAAVMPPPVQEVTAPADQPAPVAEVPAALTTNDIGSDAAPVSPDPAPSALPAINVAWVTVSDKNPVHPGIGNTIVIVANGNSPVFYTRQKDDPVTGEPIFANTHSTGQKIYLGGCIALYVTLDKKTATQLWPNTPVPLPDGTLTPPTSASPPPANNTPPASDPAPVARSQFEAVAQGVQLPADYDATKLSVDIAFADGVTPNRSYSAADATDKGDIPTKFGIVTRSLVLYDAANEFWVFFMPEVGGARFQLAFLYGRPLDKTATVPAPMPAYTATIKYDGQVLGEITTPYHFFGSQFRYLSKTYAAQIKPADIFAQKILPPFGDLPSKGKSIPHVPPVYTPMGNSNVTPGEPNTGERPDIGPVNEFVGWWLATGSDDAFASMMTWAEVMGTIPVHMRDPATFDLWNWDSYPNKAFMDFNVRTPGAAVPAEIAGQYPIPDIAHMPSLVAIAYEVTGDPYMLMMQQAAANWYLEHSFDQATKLAMFNLGQTRGYAWAMRNTNDAERMSPVNATGGLLPKSYFKARLDRNLQFMLNNYVNATTFKEQVFFSGTETKGMAFWQEDYLCIMLGILVYAGREEWRPVFEWKYRSDIARSVPEESGWLSGVVTGYDIVPPYPKLAFDPASQGNGSLQPISDHGSGGRGFRWQEGIWKGTFVDDTHYKMVSPTGKTWPYSYALGSQYNNSDGSLYFILVADPDKPPKAGDTFTVTVTMPKSWAELAAVQLSEPADDAGATALVPTTDGSLSKSLSLEYPQYVRAAHAIAKLNGTPRGAELFTRYDQQTRDNYPLRYRWALAA